MRRALLLLAALPACLLLVVAVRTLRFRSRQMVVAPVPVAAVDPGAADRLAQAIRFQTVSHQEAKRLDREQFLGLHRHLAEGFPALHQALDRELVARYSLLFTWRGRDARLPPLLLLSHLDVVPVEPGTERAWTHPPFAGWIGEGYIWGRGAMDDKAGVLGLLEAVEDLVRTGYQPRRTIYLAFGHDEEVGGGRGAGAIAALLATRGIRPALVLDEGLPIADGLVPGVPGPVAMVGTAEKGYLSVELVVRSEGGHSSTPPRRTAVGTLAGAIQRLERELPPPAIRGATARLLAFLGPEMPLGQRVAFANLWLFRRVVERALAGSPATDALIRTTTAPTMLEGSVKENVLPARARGVVNFRIRPGDSIEGVLAHVRATVRSARVAIAPFGTTMSEPSPEAPTDSPEFRALQRTIGQVFPGVLVTPSLVLGGTDARHYAALCPNVFRFLPLRVTADDLRRPHGTDERIGVDDYEHLVRFYGQLIRNLDGPQLDGGP